MIFYESMYTCPRGGGGGHTQRCCVMHGLRNWHSVVDLEGWKEAVSQELKEEIIGPGKVPFWQILNSLNPGGGGGGNHVYMVYGDVPLKRVTFFQKNPQTPCLRQYFRKICITTVVGIYPNNFWIFGIKSLKNGPKIKMGTFFGQIDP